MGGGGEGEGVLPPPPPGHEGSTYLPTRIPPPTRLCPASGFAMGESGSSLARNWPWLALRVSQLYRTVPQRVGAAITNGPPGWFHDVRSQIGTSLQFTPAAP